MHLLIFSILHGLFLSFFIPSAQLWLLQRQFNIPDQYLKAREIGMQDLVYQVNQKSVQVAHGCERRLPLLQGHR